MVLGHLCLGLYPAGKGPFQPPHPVLLYEVLVCAGVAGSQGGTACHAVRAAGYPQLSTGESGMEVGVWLPGIIDDTCTEITVPEQGDGGDQPCSCAVSP